MEILDKILQMDKIDYQENTTNLSYLINCHIRYTSPWAGIKLKKMNDNHWPII
jgi:hypothetical protein